jgi:muramoyltetrapeptide carboxypeptidase
LALNGKEKNKIDLLKKGDSVGIVAPGLPSPKDVLEKGIDKLEKMGFRCKLGKHLFDITGQTAGKAEDRADDLNNFFSNDRIKAIFTTRGGANCNQILPFLDYELIRRNPKIFLGLSDVTCVLNAISAKTGITTFHGPVLLMIGGGIDGKAFSEYSRGNFQKILTKEQVDTDRLTNVSKKWFVFKKGVAKGKLFGGNLNSLMSIVGTPYEPGWENSILFWETIGEKIEQIDQMLTQFKLAGVFNKISGMMVGRLVDMQPTDDVEIGCRILEMILDQCKDYTFPIIYGVDFGHINNNLILPVGGKVSFNTEDDFIKIIEY